MAEPNTESESKNTTKEEERTRRIRQNSDYGKDDKPSPNNNLFWENASNPLSSKGN